MEKKNWLYTGVDLLTVVGCIAPALLALVFIYLYGVNAPEPDEWVLYSFIQKYLAGEYSFFALQGQHFVHHHDIPIALMLWLGNLTQFSHLSYMYLSWVIATATGGILFFVFLRENRHLGWGIWLVLLPVAWLFFCTRQAKNILVGWQLCIYLVNFFFLLSLFSLSRSRKLDGPFFLAAICALGGSFSFASGLTIWLIGFGYLWMTRDERENSSRQQMVVWAIFFLVTLVVYFATWSPTVRLIGVEEEYSVPLTEFLTHSPLSFLPFLLTNLGGSMAATPEGAEIVGAVLFGVLIYLVWINRNRLSSFVRENAVWWGMVLFALFSSGMILVGRLQAGQDWAFLSRYTTMTLWMVVGIYGMILRHLSRRGHLSVKSLFKTRPFSLLFPLFLFGVAVGYSRGIDDMMGHYHLQKLRHHNFRQFPRISDDLFYLVAPFDIPERDQELLEELLEFTKRHKVGLFASPVRDFFSGPFLPSPAPAGLREIEGASTKDGFHFTCSRRSPLHLKGWALDRGTLLPSGRIRVCLGEKYKFDPVVGHVDENLSDQFGYFWSRFGGFTLEISPGKLAPGKYSIYIEVASMKKRGYRRSRTLGEITVISEGKKEE